MTTATMRETELTGGFFSPKHRRLYYSVGIAIVIEAGFAFWIGSSVLHNVKKELTPQIPVQVHIVKPIPPKPKPKKPKPPPKVIPKVATPIPTHQIMPNIKPPPVMPELAAQANANVLPLPVKNPLPPPPANSIYVKQQFTDAVTAAINAQKKYPREALVAGHTGTVVVSFTYLDGHATDIKLVQRAQDQSLNQEALQMVRSAHLPTPPPSLQGQPITLTIPIQFNLQ